MHPRTAGKFIEIAGERFLVKGTSYGTFAPSDANGHFPPLEQVRADFALMARSGFNTVRTYTVPSLALLDEAAHHGLRVMVGLPWSQHVAFLDDARSDARYPARGHRARQRCLVRILPHCMFAVGNEIPPAVVRWHGAAARRALSARPLCRRQGPRRRIACCRYVNFPPTEYLDLSIASTSARSTSTCTAKPTCARTWRACSTSPVSSRCCSPRPAPTASARGRSGQAAITAMHLRAAFEEGLCGAVAFAWTDEWWRGGHADRGLGVRPRRCAIGSPKPALAAVSAAFASERRSREARTRTWPKVSVVVCAYNAARHARRLPGLARGGSTYPDFEVIVVNDGSRDRDRRDRPAHTAVRVIDMPNGGLSAARNVGLAAATGEIVAYTDADVRVDRGLAHLSRAAVPDVGCRRFGRSQRRARLTIRSMAQCVRARAGRADARAARRSHRRARARLQHGVPARGAARHRRVQPDLSARRRRRRRLLAAAGEAAADRLRAVGARLAPPSAVDQGVLAPAGRLRRGRGVARGAPPREVRTTAPCCGTAGSTAPCRSSARCRGAASTAASGERRRFRPSTRTSVHPAQLLPHSPAWLVLSTLALIAGAAAVISGYIGLTVVLLAGVLGWLTTVARCLRFGWRSDLDGVATRARRLEPRWSSSAHRVAALPSATGAFCRTHPREVVAPADDRPGARDASDVEGSDRGAVRHPCIGASPDRRCSSGALLERDVDLVRRSAHRTDGLLRASRPARAVQVDDGFRADRDLSVSVGKWGWLDVRSLLEEHGGARCLLRVGLRLRLTMLGVALALSVLLALLLARTIVLVEWPWGSVGLAVAVTLVVGHAAWRTSSAVSATRAAVERAAITVGMTPIRLRTRPRSRPALQSARRVVR